MARNFIGASYMRAERRAAAIVEPAPELLYHFTTPNVLPQIAEIGLCMHPVLWDRNENPVVEAICLTSRSECGQGYGLEPRPIWTPLQRYIFNLSEDAVMLPDRRLARITVRIKPGHPFLLRYWDSVRDYYSAQQIEALETADISGALNSEYRYLADIPPDQFVEVVTRRDMRSPWQPY